MGNSPVPTPCLEYMEVRGEDPIPMVHKEGEGENYWMKTAMKAPLVLDRSLPVSSKVLLAWDQGGLPNYPVSSPGRGTLDNLLFFLFFF